MKRSQAVRALLASDEPSIRWKVRVHVLGEDPSSPQNQRLQQQIRTSPRVRALLDGAATESYRKWQGRHWVLQTLADIGHPAGDGALEPLAASVLKTWLHQRYYREYDPSIEPRVAGKAPLQRSHCCFIFSMAVSSSSAWPVRCQHPGHDVAGRGGDR